MHCKLLWIKASAKCIHVNVNMKSIMWEMISVFIHKLPVYFTSFNCVEHLQLLPFPMLTTFIDSNPFPAPDSHPYLVSLS